MPNTFMRRTAAAVASGAVAAAGLLALAGPASAATSTTGDRPAAVSHTTRPADAHVEGRALHWDEGSGRHDGDRRADRGHHDDGQRHGSRDGRDGRDHDERSRHQVSEDDLRLQWYLDQIEWLRDHGTRL
ncbi:hypothetical protein ACWEFL_32165 [Streptomyces sp. NPDC004838]